MFYNLPCDLQLCINAYDTDFLTIKILIFKEKVNSKLCDLKNKLKNFNRFLDNIKDIENYTCYLEKHIVSNCFVEQLHTKKRFEISPKVKIHFNDLKYQIEHYNDIDCKCFKKIQLFCKHNNFSLHSNYDYHKPRYTSTCKLCKMSI